MVQPLTVEDAAAIMGVAPQTLRVGLQKGVFPFGAALRMPGSSRYTYVIYTGEFMRLYGTAERCS